MSSESTPIDRAAFAEAITELPLSAIYGKVLELRNSISHLHRSNAELLLFLAEYPAGPAEEKNEMAEYITENEGVVVSIEERLLLLKTELENRGQSWDDVDVASKSTGDKPADGNEAEKTHSGNQNGSTTNTGEEGGVFL